MKRAHEFCFLLFLAVILATVAPLTPVLAEEYAADQANPKKDSVGAVGGVDTVNANAGCSTVSGVGERGLDVVKKPGTGKPGEDTTTSGSKTEKEPPKNWLIAIGINEYMDKRLPSLRFCENDARIVNEYFLKSNLVDPARAYLLVTSSSDPELKPLRRNIRQKFEHILKYATDGSLIVFYVASHGVTGSGAQGHCTGYFVPSDGNLDDLKETALDLVDIQNQLQNSVAGRTLLMADACRTQITETRAAGPVNQGSLFEQIRKTKGHFFLASCSDTQVSYEMEDARHGAFTHFLVQGLTGKAANPEGRVTLENLYSYVKNNLRDWADKNCKQVMEPFINIDRWSGDPLVLAFAPVTINYNIVAPPPAPGGIMLPPPLKIDAPPGPVAGASSLEDLDKFVQSAEYFDGYKAFKHNMRDMKTTRAVGDKEREKFFWLSYAAAILAYAVTGDLSAESDYKDNDPVAVQKIAETKSAADAKAARDILAHYENHPKAGKYFKKYINLIDKKLQTLK